MNILLLTQPNGICITQACVHHCFFFTFTVFLHAMQESCLSKTRFPLRNWWNCTQTNNPHSLLLMAACGRTRDRVTLRRMSRQEESCSSSATLPLGQSSEFFKYQANSHIICPICRVMCNKCHYIGHMQLISRINFLLCTHAHLPPGWLSLLHDSEERRLHVHQWDHTRFKNRKKIKSRSRFHRQMWHWALVFGVNFLDDCEVHTQDSMIWKGKGF